MKDSELEEKVIKHEYQFQTLSKSLENIVSELHQITLSMKNVAVLAEQISNMDKNSKESFMRVHNRISLNEDDIKLLKNTQDFKGCSSLKLKTTEIDSLNRTVYGKDGRGGLVFDIEDIKKFMYKAMGAFAILQIFIATVAVEILK